MPIDANDRHYYGLQRSGPPPVGTGEVGRVPGGDPNAYWNGGISATLHHPDGDPTHLWASSGPFTSSTVSLSDFADLAAAAAFVMGELRALWQARATADHWVDYHGTAIVVSMEYQLLPLGRP